MTPDHSPRAAYVLRRRAIAWEDGAGDLPTRWARAMALYARAWAADPTDLRIPHSAAVTAVRLLDEASAPAAWDLAWTWVARGLALDPHDAGMLGIAGQVAYASRGVEEALRWLDAAVTRPGADAWALLCRAHCLHDLGRWTEAAYAYDAVPIDAFHGPAAWRGPLARVQGAVCALHAGDRARGLAALDAVFAAWPDDEHTRTLVHEELVDAAEDGLLNPATLARVPTRPPPHPASGTTAARTRRSRTSLRGGGYPGRGAGSGCSGCRRSGRGCRGGPGW